MPISGLVAEAVVESGLVAEVAEVCACTFPIQRAARRRVIVLFII